jgi:hypothetical protein
MVNFSEKQEKELIKILSNSFDNAQTFEEHKKQMKTQKTFYWSPETLDFFQLLLHSEGIKKAKESMSIFVHNECDLEDNETFEDLINDLIFQVKNTNLEDIENLKK